MLAAAKQLAYRRNPAARSLITGKTGNMGMVVPDLENPFYTSILRGAQARAHQTGYAVLLADSGEDPAAEANLVHTMTNQVDGVIICAPFAADAELVAASGSDLAGPHQSRAARRFPALMDVARGMRKVVVHLAALGHRRCAYLGRPAQCVVGPRATSRPSRGDDAAGTAISHAAAPRS